MAWVSHWPLTGGRTIPVVVVDEELDDKPPPVVVVTLPGELLVVVVDALVAVVEFWALAATTRRNKETAFMVAVAFTFESIYEYWDPPLSLASVCPYYSR